MAWPAQYPPISGEFKTTEFDKVIALWNACRERFVITTGRSNVPQGSFPWSTPAQSGIVTAAAISGTNLRFTDSAADDDGIGWVDGSSVKRWTSFGGTFNGNTIDPTPNAFKLVLYRPDTGTPIATVLGDPGIGSVHDIEDNGDTWIEIFNDGTLFLNGLVISDYVGWLYQIVRQGANERNGVGWVDRIPWRPNDKAVYYGAITASTTSSITDTRTGLVDQWRSPIDLEQFVGKDIIFDMGGKWIRTPILSAVVTTGTIKDKVTFAAQASAPGINNPGYWIMDSGKFWLPRNRLELVRRQARRGKYWDRSGFTDSWHAGSIWNQTYGESYLSHAAEADDLTGCSHPIEKVTLDFGGGDFHDINVFDFDGRTEHNDPSPQDDKLFNPRMYWACRGIQLFIEGCKASGDWIEPKDYDGEPAIPVWTNPSWWRYNIAANTQRVTITSTTSHTGGDAGFSSFTMPSKTAGETHTSLPCTFTLYDARGNIKYDSLGTVTATTLTDAGTRGFIDHRLVEEGDTDTDIGLDVVIAFCGDVGSDVHTTYDLGSQTRRHARLVKYLYPRTYWQPESFEHTDIGDPDFPGSWVSNTISTNYAEYTKFGILQEDAHALITNELAYYLADSFEHPTTSATSDDGTLPFADIAFQGVPNVGTAFPRWEGAARTGVITEGGTFYIRDTAQLWWCSAGPAVPAFTGTLDSGSTTTLCFDSTKSTNGYWQQVDWFKGMVMEVEMDPSGSPGVYTRRPITSYDHTEQKCVVAPGFPSATNGKAYKIRVPGSDATSGGIILNLWEKRKLKVTRASGDVGYAVINYSDDDTLYFTANALGFTPATGDTYEIMQVDPGSVVKYQPSSLDVTKTASGWVAQEKGTKPTICTSFGRYRKRDYTGIDFWNECYKCVDSLRWTKDTFGWHNYPSDGGTPEVNEMEVGGEGFYLVTYGGGTGRTIDDAAAESASEAQTDWASFFSTADSTNWRDNTPPSLLVDEFALTDDGGTTGYTLFQEALAVNAYGFYVMPSKLNQFYADVEYLALGAITNADPAEDVDGTLSPEFEDSQAYSELLFNTSFGFSYRKFKSLYTTHVDSTDIGNGVYTTKVGPPITSTMPSATGVPDPGGVGGTADHITADRFTGCALLFPTIIFKWDTTTGGLTYCTH